MRCRDFELALDRGLELLSRADRARLEAHARQCRGCEEVLALARLPAAEPGELAARVISRTTGSACGRAEQLLPDLVDGSVTEPEVRQLLAGHIEHCSACAGLAVELERLARELPRLAVVDPGESLVEAVLSRTLPATVRLRRWWSASWPSWVRRPRFATELAYALTLVLVVIFGTPFSPLQAMPERALDFARTESSERLGRLDELRSATGGELAGRLGAAAESGRRRAGELARSTSEAAGTILEEVASWFVTAEDDTPAETHEIEEETS